MIDENKFLVILPRNAFKIFGLVGGIEFHVFKYVSFTHSFESSRLYRILFAIVLQ